MILLKALITGASGFVGKVMTNTLLNSNVEVMGISRTDSSLNGQLTEKYKCDIQDKTRLRELLKLYKPNYIIHLAGPAFIPSSINKPEMTYDIIFRGTLNLLENVRELKLDSRILYISSADVYGASSKSFLSEMDIIDPNNPYASAKACAELLCKQFYHSYGTDVLIARPFNHTGPGQSPDFVCSSFACQIAKMQFSNKRSLVTGNIDVERDFLDVRDVAQAYLGLLKHGITGEIYNVCSSRAISIRRIIEMLFEEADIREYDLKLDKDLVRKKDIPLRVGDNSKLVRSINWIPQFSINETVKDLLSYWKENAHVGK